MRSEVENKGILDDGSEHVDADGDTELTLDGVLGGSGQSGAEARWRSMHDGHRWWEDVVFHDVDVSHCEPVGAELALRTATGVGAVLDHQNVQQANEDDVRVILGWLERKYREDGERLGRCACAPVPGSR